jgi:hypothetical protein
MQQICCPPLVKGVVTCWYQPYGGAGIDTAGGIGSRLGVHCLNVIIGGGGVGSSGDSGIGSRAIGVCGSGSGAIGMLGMGRDGCMIWGCVVVTNAFVQTMVRVSVSPVAVSIIVLSLTTCSGSFSDAIRK